METDTPTQLGPNLNEHPVQDPPQARCTRERGQEPDFFHPDPVAPFSAKDRDGLAGGPAKGFQLQTGPMGCKAPFSAGTPMRIGTWVAIPETAAMPAF